MVRHSRRAIGSLAALAVAATLATTAVPAQAQDVAADDLLLSYDFTTATGTDTAAVVPDGSGHGRTATVIGGAARTPDGLTLDGVDDYVQLPGDVLAGVTDITISAEVRLAANQATPYFLWGFGNTTDGAGNGYLFATGNAYRAGIASGNWSTEQVAGSGANLTRDAWHTLTYTQSGTTSRLYLDGAQVATNTNVSLTPGSIGAGSTTRNAIGRSVYDSDRLLQGTVRSFDVWDAALSADQVASLAPADADRVERDAAQLTLGDTSAVTADLALPPTGGYGSTIAWATSDPGVVTAEGVVTRPADGGPDASATLTATVARGGATRTRTFDVTVLAQLDPGARAQADLDALVLANADDVRGNLTLPSTGAVHGSTLAWTASPAGIVATEAADGRSAGVVTRPAADTVVTLTATVPGTTATRAIPVTVTAAPADLDDDYSAGYLWTHFAVEGGYEKIFMGHSDDGLQWSKLNDNTSILANLGGDLGVRDPHLVRSPEGDRYWIIGTDLHAEGGGPGGSGWDQLNASQNIVVWESTDLVTWSDQRIVFAGFDAAGCVWAPEAVWNEATGEYYVYWSARDRGDVDTPDWALRVYLTKTRDFVTFSEPEIWASLNEQGDGAGGANIIDSSIAVEDGVYYRFSTSDWDTVIDTAPSLDGPWTTVVAKGEAAAHGLRPRMEGLTVFPLPDGRWALYGDENAYYGHVTDSLASLQFTQLTTGTGPEEFSFEEKFRHGSVLQLTRAEEERLLAAYGDPEPEPQGLVAEYTFDDGTLADSVGDNDLTSHGSAAVVTDAERGSVLRLDGTAGGYASFPTGFFDGRDEMTVSFDMRSDLTGGNFFSFAFGKDQQSYYFLRTRGGEVRSALTASSWQGESAVTGSVAPGAWHRYDVVLDGRTTVVYVDGVKLGENTALSASVADLGSDLAGYLGRSFYAGDGYFAGAFDDVRIHDRALTADELVGKDQLLDVSLTTTGVLKIDPIVSGADRTVTFPVVPGTPLTALAPTFSAATGVTVSPASGTPVDLSTPVTYTLTADDGARATWTMSAVEMRSPVLPGLYADPNIAIFGDTYYIYATSDGFPGWGGKEFYVWSSPDLVDWTRSEEPFLTLDGANGNVPWASGNAWAPTIIERAGKYYFYFSGHNDSVDRKTIGVAVADSPEGPFTAQPQAMILNDGPVTSGQAIDPAAFHDPVSGKYFLYWGNGRPVYAELAEDMVSLVPGTIAAQEGLVDYREGSFMNYRDGIYHLTYSIDDTGSPDYRVGYATSASPHGPWTYRGVILSKDTSLGILGTGHHSIVQVPGTDDWYVAYHRFAMPGGNGNNRETTIDRVTFGADGLIQPIVPTLESVGPQTIEVETAPPSAVTVTPSTATLEVGEQVALTAAVAPVGADQDVAWSSSAPLTATVDGTGTVTAHAPGRVEITATSLAAGSISGTASVTVTDTDVPPPLVFTDVREGDQFFDEISWLSQRGITTGWLLPDGTREYRPVTPVARDAMAAFLYRLAGSPAFTAPEVSPFTDLDLSNQFYKEITWLHATGISTGWPQTDGTAEFRPLDPIARDAMAAFLYRYADQRDGIEPGWTPPTVSPFSDVGTGSQFYEEIAWLADTGIATGWTGAGNDGTDIYQPLSPVNRDAMAAFMNRLHHHLTQN
ncbi:family 43 glycosylhydrolase [Serinibacter arcticus]|uniref:Glycerol-3-phosphate ABC transporter, periplasmic glycerol-3-phosphate-binding protein n=1 Tax=Serinibacter arcticus TaxID=1655435 RepID=A0A4Z1E0M1_9MICO|nr:family 43 glycosylhydrolase [Serinibacter arcticus]TGO04890.1 Glycerol-3-phosphate ABC transporter, periplasmic glycerol-3-phosphate-binding protein [Serinibacter arcticus]